MIAAGCRVTGIQWISETLTDDGNTWVSELQHNGKFNNNGYFTWKHFTHDAKTAERKTVKKRTKWSEWTKHVKRVTKQAIEEKAEENEQLEKEKSLDNGGSEDDSRGEAAAATAATAAAAAAITATEEAETAATAAEAKLVTAATFATEEIKINLGTGKLGMTMKQTYGNDNDADGYPNITVTNVEMGGEAERCGVKPGMILIKVGEETVRDWRQARSILRELPLIHI